MAVNWVVYSQFKLATQVNLNNANLAAGGDTVKVMLANSGYNPNANNDQFANTARTYEVSNGNGGAGTYKTTNANNLTISGSQTCTLSSNVVTANNSNANVITWVQDSANGFSGANAAMFVIIYKATGNDANSPLIAYANLGSNQTNTTGSLTLQLDANGIFTLT